jgi:NADH-quinone oxidoreductase subunit G
MTHTNELGIFNRGDHSEIGVAPGLSLDNDYSMSVVDICPVGALTSRDFRFRRRVYRLSNTEGICPGCSTGCNTVMGHYEGRLYRQQPRENLEVNDYWMCDHGRLVYKWVGADDRLLEPMVRDGEHREPAGWDHAWSSLEQRYRALGDSPRIVLVGSPHASLEELYALRSLLGDAAGGKVLGHRLAGTEMESDDGFLFSAERTPNDAGARRLGYAEFTPAQLHAAGGKDALLIILDNDLVGLDPAAAEALDNYGLVLSIGWRDDATARQAHIALPGLAYAEKSGVFVNKQGRAQLFHKAVDGPVQAREDWQLIASLGEFLGHAPTWRAHHDLSSELSVRRPEFGALAGGIPASGVLLDAAPATEEVERG